MGTGLDTQQEILTILDEVLGLGGRANAMVRESPLIGALPELDSIAVVTLLTAFEERFGFTIAGDELDQSDLSTVGALADFVDRKVSG